MNGGFQDRRILFFVLTQIDVQNIFFHDVIVLIAFLETVFPLLEVYLQLFIYIQLLDVREKIFANVLILPLQRFQYHQTRDAYKYIRIPVIQIFLELRILLCRRLQYVRKVYQVARLLPVQKVLLPLFPRLLVVVQRLHQISVVLQLRVHHFFMGLYICNIYLVYIFVIFGLYNSYIWFI
jgi:hypothetical protein